MNSKVRGKRAPEQGITLLRRAVSMDTGMPEWKCVQQLACMYIHEHPDKFHADVVTVARVVSRALGLTLDWNRAGCDVPLMQQLWREVDKPTEARLRRLESGLTRRTEADLNDDQGD